MKLLSGVGLLALVALSAGCDRPIFPPREVFWTDLMSRFDHSGDKSLDFDEYEALAGLQVAYPQYDGNEDNKIDVEELEYQITWREPRPLIDLTQDRSARPKKAMNQLAEERLGRIP